MAQAVEEAVDPWKLWEMVVRRCDKQEDTLEHLSRFRCPRNRKANFNFVKLWEKVWFDS